MASSDNVATTDINFDSEPITISISINDIICNTIVDNCAQSISPCIKTIRVLTDDDYSENNSSRINDLLTPISVQSVIDADELNKKSKDKETENELKVNIGDVTSLSMDSIAFMEDMFGVCVGRTDPIECNTYECMAIEHEAEQLQCDQDVIFRTYLLNGYVVYSRWLVSKIRLARTNILANLDDLIRFCVARHINEHGLILQSNTKKKSTSVADLKKYAMGFDVELRYILYKILTQNDNFVRETKSLSWSDARKQLANIISRYIYPIDSIVSDKSRRQCLNEVLSWLTKNEPTDLRKFRSFRPLLEMNENEFKQKLRQVSTDLLDNHSSTVWRGTVGINSVRKHYKNDNKKSNSNSNNSSTNSNKITSYMEDLIVDLQLLENGEPLAPSPGFHLGVQMLAKTNIIRASDTNDPSTPMTVCRSVAFV